MKTTPTPATAPVHTPVHEPVHVDTVITALSAASTTFSRLEALFAVIASSGAVPPNLKTIAELGKALSCEFASDTDITRGDIEEGGIAP